MSSLGVSFDVDAIDSSSSVSPSPLFHLPYWLGRKVLEPVLVVVTLTAIVLSLLVSLTACPQICITGLAIIAYLTGGFYGIQEGIKSLWGRKLNVDLLMILAALGAAAVGEWRDGAILLFLFSLSNVLQDYAIGRSRRAIQSLFALYPEKAQVKRGTEILTVPINELETGEIVLIQPGERIPVDGEVIAGQSSVDQSTITGESMPVEKTPGTMVFAGTLNQQGALDVKVTQHASESTLSRIITMVEEAQSRRAPTQRFLDEFEQYYALGVILTSILVMFAPWLLLGWSFDASFYRAMVLLVVASPCALIISTPAAFLSAIAAGARKGVIFKGGASLELLATIRAIALDKTGTLTYGRPTVTDVVPLNDYTKFDLLHFAASVESRSEHPLSRAVREEAERQGYILKDVEAFSASPGEGVEGILDGVPIRVGRWKYVTECAGQPPTELMEIHDRLQAEGKTVLLTCYGGQWLGVIAVSDQIRPEAVAAIDGLHALGITRIVMLTGDNAKVGATIAARAHLDEVHAELMPDEKAYILEDLVQKFGSVVMVGDGVNDAPALAAATVGIAMGAAGTDVALETADVVLMGDQLESIPYAIRLSRRARRIVWQNIAFALAVIITLVTTSFVVDLPLPIGVIGHEGSTVIVVVNGLRLLTGKAG
jgi:Cd2+/Zn2+-exporting ATPase